MAKLNFPSVLALYRGIVGEFRANLQNVSTACKTRPDLKAVINAQLPTFTADMGYVEAIPSTSLTIASTVKVLGPATTGAYVDGYTFTIVNGAITAIVAS